MAISCGCVMLLLWAGRSTGAKAQGAAA